MSRVIISITILVLYVNSNIKFEIIHPIIMKFISLTIFVVFVMFLPPNMFFLEQIGLKPKPHIYQFYYIVTNSKNLKQDLLLLLFLLDLTELSKGLLQLMFLVQLFFCHPYKVFHKNLKNKEIL